MIFSGKKVGAKLRQCKISHFPRENKKAGSIGRVGLCCTPIGVRFSSPLVGGALAPTTPGNHSPIHPLDPARASLVMAIVRGTDTLSGSYI